MNFGMRSSARSPDPYDFIMKESIDRDQEQNIFQDDDPYAKRRYINTDVIFADGSTMTGLLRNIDILYYDVQVDISEESLGERLNSVTIIDHFELPDGTKFDESFEKTFCKLIGPKESDPSEEHPYWIAFTERTRQEMTEQAMFATIEYVAMMANIEI